MSRVCRMLPKKRKLPRKAQQKRRVTALSKAVCEARAAREARGAEEQESANGVDLDIEMSQAGMSADSGPAARPIIEEELVAVITGLLQH